MPLTPPPKRSQKGGGDIKNFALRFFATAAARTFLTALTHLEVIGFREEAHRTALNRPRIFYANHRSFADGAVILFSRLLRVSDCFGCPHAPVSAIATRRFFTGLLKPFVGPLGIIPHAAWDMRAVLEIDAAVARGNDLLIFPEGRLGRGSYHELLRFHGGIGWLIERHGLIAVPVALIGTDRLMPAGSFRPRVGERVRVAFGEPIPNGAWWPKNRHEITRELDLRLRELIRATA